MEYAAGGSLHSILSSQDQRSKLFPSSRLYVAHALVAALEYLHANKLFHRDVKPENICLWEGWESNPKMLLIDFGIASRVAERESGTVLSTFPGTIPYMADECLRRPQKFTDKSEVFAAGVVFLNLLTGDCSLSSFDHRDVTKDEIIAHVDYSAGPWLADTEVELAALSRQCLMKNPDSRPTIPYLLTELDRLRRLAGDERYLAPHMRNRIQSHNQLARPSRLPPHVDTFSCVGCGKQRVDGVLCGRYHFTCSSGTCLEEMVREQLGVDRFKCPEPSCSMHFFLIDVYGKVPADLYHQAVLATELVHTNADLSNKLAEAVKVFTNGLDRTERNIKVEIVRASSDAIAAKLGAVHDVKEELSSIIAHLKSLSDSADEISRTRDRLEKEIQDLRSQGRLENIQEITSRLGDLDLMLVAGISLIASGRLQCPRLCFLLPVQSRRGIQSRLVLANEYQLYFLCAHDRSPVKTSVLIRDPKKWVRKAAPFVRFALFSLRMLVTVYGGIQDLPDVIGGNTLQEKMDNVLGEMELLLTPEDIRSIEEWVAGVSDRPELMNAISCREREISEEAYGALVEEAYKPSNRGWKNEMEIGRSKGGSFAWVKKENVGAWKLSAL
jgi:Protein kinase domain